MTWFKTVDDLLQYPWALLLYIPWHLQSLGDPSQMAWLTQVLFVVKQGLPALPTHFPPWSAATTTVPGATVDVLVVPLTRFLKKDEAAEEIDAAVPEEVSLFSGTSKTLLGSAQTHLFITQTKPLEEKQPSGESFWRKKFATWDRNEHASPWDFWPSWRP
jgi:hypothetical protein